MVLQQKQLEKANFIVKITGPVMVQLASSNKWKVPLVSTATTPFAHFFVHDWHYSKVLVFTL